MSNTFRPGPAGKVTIVEEGTEFKGTLTSSCPIDVRGRVEGELHTPSLTVGPTGAVHGRAKVGVVRSEGEISGEFDAESIELAGVVRDNTVIRARSLDVKLTSSRGKLQIIFGECELAVGDEPTEMDRVVEAAQVPLEAAPVEAMVAVAAAAPEAAPEASDIVVAEAPAAPPADAKAEEQVEGEQEELEADGSGGKRKRKRKNGQDEVQSGWSNPPSRPPPAG